MIRTDLGAPLGSKIVLQKLLALGARDFTLLGRPVLPLDLAQVRVNQSEHRECVIDQSETLIIAG